MLLRFLSVTKILLFLIVQKTLPAKSAGYCESATLRSNPTLIDDCDFVNDELNIDVFKITELVYRSCLHAIYLRASVPEIETDIVVDGQESVTIPNPLQGANRCREVKIWVIVRWVWFDGNRLR